jgi:phosphoglycolate phosphatase
MREHFVPYYNQHKCDFTRPYEGITETLETLSDMGIRFAVASNKYQEGTEQLVRQILGRFDFVKILGERKGKPIKPDPLIVQEAMDGINGISLDEVIYCGDSDVDMQTGINAGVKTVGVTWGFRTREELQAYNPYALIDRPCELIQIISKS